MKDFERRADRSAPRSETPGLDADFAKAIERLERQALVQVTPTQPRHAFGQRNWDQAAFSLHQELSRRQTRRTTWTVLRPAALIGAVAAGVVIGMTLIGINMTGPAWWGVAIADLPAKFRDTFNAVAEDDAKTATSDTLLPAEQIPAKSLETAQPVAEADLNQNPPPPAPPPPVSSSVAQTQLATVEPSRPITLQSGASAQFDLSEIASLLERGRKLVAAGDIASARLIFGRLTRTGNLDAIVSLADTFDPANLARLKVSGSLANPTKAQELYRMAAQAGSEEAKARLEDPARRSRQ